LKEVVGSGVGRISYYNYNLSAQLRMTTFQSGSNRVMPKIRALYSAALYSAVSSTQYVDKTNSTYRDIVIMLGGEKATALQAAVDSWGNIRIPKLESLPDYDSGDPHRWVAVPWQDSVQNYASLIGDRIEGVDWNFTGNTTFNISSGYQHFDVSELSVLRSILTSFVFADSIKCSPWMRFNESETDRWLLTNLKKNLTTVRTPNFGQRAPRTFFVESSELANATASSTSKNGHPKLIFGTMGDAAYMSITECSTHMTYVDTQVFCISKGTMGKANCGVSSIRKTLSTTDPTDLTVLEPLHFYQLNTTATYDRATPENFMEGFMDLLDDNQTGSGASTVVEWYIKDPLTALNNPAMIAYANLEELDISVFEVRFSLLWNTLWKLSQEYASIMGGNMTRTMEADTFVFDYLLNTTSATKFTLPTLYAIDLPWMALYFISVGVMFFAAVFSLVMHHRCHAPPLLGFVSSLVQDPRFFSDIGNSAEDGAKKTKRLGALRVMLADVQSGHEIGKMAFAPVEAADKRIKRGRWYE
jgi:hypothetical protein